MHKIRPTHPDHCDTRDCSSRKKGYPTKAVCRQAIAEYRRDNPRVPELRAYKCPFCRLWHITSQRPRS